MLKAITLGFLSMAWAALADYFEPSIMQLLGTSKAAGFIYVYVIFLIPMIALMALAVKSYQAWATRKKKAG
jgi:hypothetical protein